MCDPTESNFVLKAFPEGISSRQHCPTFGMLCAGSNSASPGSKKRRKSNASTAPPSEEAQAALLAEALHLLQRSQAVGESGIEALNGEGGVQEIDNTIVGADATIKAWRFMQV